MMAKPSTKHVTDTEKKRREFRSPPGIYIITGCRNIGFEDEPEVKQNGTRMKSNTNTPFNSHNKLKNAIKLAKKLNGKASGVLRLN